MSVTFGPYKYGVNLLGLLQKLPNLEGGGVKKAERANKTALFSHPLRQARDSKDLF